MILSVIVPVYNVYDYLEKCVDSIVKQVGCDYEVILVDDGSTDGSATLCDFYARQHPMIRVIHKDNGGLSDARNVGMANAKGKYLMFIDSDDWIEEGCFQRIREQLQRTAPDVLFTRLLEVRDTILDKDVSMAFDLRQAQTKMDYIRWLMEKSKNAWPAVTKIVARSFVEENHLQFVPGRLHEDVDWTSKLCYNANSFAFCDVAWYYHRMGRSGSIGNSVRGKNITDVIETASDHYVQYSRKRDEMHAVVMNRIMKTVFSSINKVRFCSAEDAESVAQCMEENRSIFVIQPTLKIKAFVGLMNATSPRMAIGLLRALGRH